MDSRLFSWSLLAIICVLLVESTMSSLWDDEVAIDLQSSDPEPNFTGLELGAIEPGQLVAFERNKQNAIIMKTVDFARALKSCENVVLAAYKVSAYVPPFRNDDQAQFWKQKVIPVLVRSLEQDVIARSVIARSFNTVGDVAVVIQSVYQIIRRSRGSKRAIAVAKKSIPAVMNKLNASIARVNNLESNAITSFAAQTKQIFEIVGPETVNFAEKKAVIDESIRQKRIQQQNLIFELGKAKGDVESNNYLMAVTEKHIRRTDADLQEAEKRKLVIEELNGRIEMAIQSIPTKVNNPNRDSDLRYYNNIITSRVERLQTMAKNGNLTLMVVQQLEKELAGYKAGFDESITKLKKLEPAFKESFDKLEKAIEEDLDAKRKVDESASFVYNKIGLEGNPLSEALTQVNIFSRSLNKGASAYTPFATVLLSIKSLVEVQAELLSSDESSDIFLAATLLLEQAKFLSEYTISAQQIMKTGEEYDQRAIVKTVLGYSGAGS